MGVRQTIGTLYRADLLWCLSAITEDQLGQLATLLGFIEDQPLTKEPQKEDQKQLPEKDIQPPEPDPQPIIIQSNAQTSSYYRIIDRHIDADKMDQAQLPPDFPEWFAQAEGSYFEETQTRIPALHRVTPNYPTLVPWSRLWPMLLRVLGTNVPSSKPDINQLVKKVCQGQQIRRIPKRSRFTWAENIRVLIDINDGNFPYRQDFLRLQQQLLAWRGSDGLDVQFIYDEPGVHISQYQNGKETIVPWCHPESNTPLLILSDLGLHIPSRRSLYQWLVFGQALNLNGIRATVLLPVAEPAIDQRLLRYFDCIVWDGHSALKPLDSQQPAEPSQPTSEDSTETLLSMLFPALRVELGLLRTVRHILPAHAADVSHEAAVWHHKEVNAVGDEWAWQAATRTKYQGEFLKLFNNLTEEKQQQLIQQLGIYHAQLPDELYFEAMYELIRLDLPVPEAVKTATLDFMAMLVKTYHQHPEHQELDWWVKRCLSRQDLANLRSEHLLAFLAIERRRAHAKAGTPIVWPKDIDLSFIKPFIEQPANAVFLFVRQVGMELELAARSAPFYPADDWGDQSHYLVKMAHLTDSVTLRYPTNPNQPSSLSLNPQTDLPYRFNLPPGQNILAIAEETYTLEVRAVADWPDWAVAQGFSERTIFVDSQNQAGVLMRWYWHPPELGENLNPETFSRWYTQPGFWYSEPPRHDQDLKPDWADRVGRDQYGLYAEVAIAGITQRFRWIQPGSFLMGSPQDEIGRWEAEIQHPVILSQGYWLADTACTQALWQAVMRTNPSDFKGDNRPVESVSWHDVQQFIQTLNQRHPKLNLRLPSEAEWEYACRAGKDTAFNFDGELTVDNVNYRGTWEYQTDNWGERALQQTAEVKSYPGNAWGLYEMHGNVWEWCQDWYGAYPAAAITDPYGPESGDYRVLRGGSWFGHGRNCRSAIRYRDGPGRAFNSFGFRLARGHEPSQISTGAGQPPDGTRAAVARGAQPGVGLRQADELKPPVSGLGNKLETMFDLLKDKFRK
jgi:formylglycine-generating enzyme required for sulfatase activity